MILQALCQYYQRRQQDSDTALPPYGFEEKAIPFLVVINRDGKLVRFEKTGELVGKKWQPQQFRMAKSVKRAAGVAANVLWDPAGYVLGVDSKGKPERTAEQRTCFIQRIETVFDHVRDDPGIAAVLRFYQQPQQDTLAAQPEWAEILDTNPVMTFRLLDDVEPVFLREAVLQAYRQWLEQSTEGADSGLCLVSGEVRPVARLHSSIKGVWGAQPIGASVVSFNLDAFRSWGKEQGANSPVSEQAAFEYTTALNALLQTDSPNRIQLGETSVVCWAAKAHPLESALSSFFAMSRQDNPDQNVGEVRDVFQAIHKGHYHHSEADEAFYVLGLSPNAARVAIRFWLQGTVASFAGQIEQWVDDIEIAGSRYARPDVPRLMDLLRSTALLGESDNLSPLLAGETVRAILTGQPLPHALLMAVLQRIKAEQGKVNEYRAALIKAYLNRKARYNPQDNQESLTMSLNPDDKRPGYVLGRLFAVLEKLQQDASPGLNSTIRDRYYSSASSTPQTVFGTLIRLHHHHLSKLDKPGWKVATEKRIQDIVEAIDEFPAHLNVEQQGLFAIGYYHQCQDLYKKTESSQGAEA